MTKTPILSPRITGNEYVPIADGREFHRVVMHGALSIGSILRVIIAPTKPDPEADTYFVINRVEDRTFDATLDEREKVFARCVTVADERIVTQRSTSDVTGRTHAPLTYTPDEAPASRMRGYGFAR